MISQTGPRILLYSHDSYGLGHLRRSMTLAHEIAERMPHASMLCVTGSPRPDLFRLPANFDYVKLPSVTKNEKGAYVAKRLSVSLGEVVAVRAAILCGVYESFRPDLVLVDHSVQGVGGELRGLLSLARRSRPRPRILLGMRDIVDEPKRAARQLNEPGCTEQLRHTYDKILVYGDPRITDVARDYELPADVAAKVDYVGIVCGCLDYPAVPRRSTEPHVLVTAGGGGDGYPLLRSTVAAYRGPLADLASRVTLVTGPLMSASKRTRLMRAARADRRLHLTEATRNMCGMVRSADLVLAMGGYNSVYEALQAERRLLVLPRVHPRLEQHERARRLEALGLLTCLATDDVEDPTRLAARIRGALQASPPRPCGLGLQFDGARRMADEIAHALESAPLSPPAPTSRPSVPRDAVRGRHGVTIPMKRSS